MLKLILGVVLQTASALATAQTGFVLNATIIGFEDSTRIIINKTVQKNGEESLAPDQILFLINQRFSFSDDITSQTRFSVRIRPKDILDEDFTKYENVFFWAENKPMFLTAERGAVAFADVTGSDMQDEFEKFRNLEREKELRNKQMADSFRMYYRDIPAATLETMQASFRANNIDIEKASIMYIYNHPEHYFSLSELAFRATKIPESVQRNRVMAFYEQLSQEYKNDGYGQQIKNYIDGRISFKPLSTGKKSHPFSLPDSAGVRVSLSKMKGKVVLLDFWFAACAPCRFEHKNYLLVYQAYQEKGFEIISVNVDEKKEMWKNAMQKDSMIWRSVWDPQKKVTSDLYHVTVFPTNYLINTKGEIIAQDLRGETLATALETIFSKK